MAARIEIAGGIASGKTTLAEVLEEQRIKVKFENFKANPFWQLFYTDPSKFAFETEITFLLQHYNQIKIAKDDPRPFALDTSLIQDAAYAEVNLRGRQKDVFDRVYEEVRQSLDAPTLLIHLICPPEEQLRRVKARARTEENSIELAYLTALTHEIDDLVNEAAAEIQTLEIDSVRTNFATNPKTRSEVARSILKLV